MYGTALVLGMSMVAALVGVAMAQQIEDVDLRHQFQHETSALVPAAPQPTPARAAKERFGGLTARERDVAKP